MAQMPDGEIAPRDGLLPASAALGSAERTLHAYLHIPFCRVRCGYCDYNTYTSSELQGVTENSFLNNLLKEIALSKNVLETLHSEQRKFSTVFFGGGTPTQLEAEQLALVLETLKSEFGLEQNAEVTTEANPDTVDERYLSTLAEAGFTRVSIGMQSSVSSVLKILDRTHNPENVAKAVGAAKSAGLQVSVDLIYGTPGESLDDWRESLSTAIDLDPDHISSYSQIVEPGTKLAVTGVVELGMTRLIDSDFSSDYPEDDSLELVLRAADDLLVLQRPSWWTPRRLAVALGGLAAVLALAVGWVVLLRREVARQSERIAAEQQTRRDAAVEYQTTLRERSRLAANLHDTVLQTVTGIGYQLEVCEGSLAQPAGDVAAKLAVADKMVGHAVQQLRGTVWALRTAAPSDRPLPEALADLADQVQGTHEAVIAVRSGGDPAPRVADFVSGNLLLVAQEAMLNALRHGHASRIDVDLSFDAATRRIGLVVRDDGCGFELGGQPGPRQGHFGIEGMRERVERLGGSLAIDTAPGSGTTVQIAVPLEAGGQPLAATLAAT